MRRAERKVALFEHGQQRRIAAEVGVDPTTFSKLKRGRGNLTTVETLARIAAHDELLDKPGFSVLELSAAEQLLDARIFPFETAADIAERRRRFEAWRQDNEVDVTTPPAEGAA